MQAQELMNVCVALLTAQSAKVDRIAARTRSTELEKWFQCELLSALIDAYPGSYREAVMEWYIHKKAAGTINGPGNCDITLISKVRTEPLLKLYKLKLLDGVYIELKTSVHNDFSPRAEKSNVVKKFTTDYDRAVKLRRHSRSRSVEAFAVALVADCTSLTGDDRAQVLPKVRRWIQDNKKLGNGLMQTIPFGSDRGLDIWIWPADKTPTSAG